MRVIITGASGHLGKALVPRLQARGVEMLLVGRNPTQLGHQFPGVACCNYEGLADKAAGFDALLNLAVINSDADASLDEFMAVNADLPSELARTVAPVGVRRFVYVSSLHALADEPSHPYAVSKRAGLDKLRQSRAMDVTALYLPAVHTDRWPGRWAFVNRLRGLPRRLVTSVLTALVPVVDIDVVANSIVELLQNDRPQRDVIATNGQSGNGFYQGSRRLMDIAAALSIAVLLWWLLILIWIAIRATSRGPGIFAQQRVGRDGVAFICYKFRTMEVGTRQAATHELTNMSVTSVGRVLRRTKLDELPQIWNLLKGEMTLVGPRPCLVSQTELIKVREDARVLALTPGITGLAQVNGVDMSVPRDLVQYDQRYLALQGLILDIRLIVLTVVGKGRGDNVRG